MVDVILTHSLSAGGTIRQFLRKNRPGRHARVIACYDDYSHGPLLTSGANAEFFEQRRQFWKAFDLYDTDILFDIDLAEDHRDLVNAVEWSRTVEIWATHSVQDIFYAIVTLRLLSRDGFDTTRIRLRHFDGDQVQWGLGGLGIEGFETLYPATTADPLDLDLYRGAWDAISHGTGGAVSEFIEGKDMAAPMTKALSAYLLRFPEFNGGLGSIDRALLGGGTEEMKKSAYTVGTAMALAEPENDSVGDLILFARLVELSAKIPDPWFKMEGDLRVMRGCCAQLTDSGRKARARYSVPIL